jgi:hypothetical protein
MREKQIGREVEKRVCMTERERERKEVLWCSTFPMVFSTSYMPMIVPLAMSAPREATTARVLWI